MSRWRLSSTLPTRHVPVAEILRPAALALQTGGCQCPSHEFEHGDATIDRVRRQGSRVTTARPWIVQYFARDEMSSSCCQPSPPSPTGLEPLRGPLSTAQPFGGKLSGAEGSALRESRPNLWLHTTRCTAGNPSLGPPATRGHGVASADIGVIRPHRASRSGVGARDIGESGHVSRVAISRRWASSFSHSWNLETWKTRRFGLLSSTGT